MQTFLPYADFYESAKALDNKRLGKQRVEVLQILNALAGKSKGWTNHPATRMWRRHEFSLAQYGIAICEEWRSRGFNDTCLYKIIDMPLRMGLNTNSLAVPPWLGNAQLHTSHQSNLVRKDPSYYKFDVAPDLPYYWPI